MTAKKTSAIGDLTEFAKRIESEFEKYFGKKAALAIAFSLSPDFLEIHWVTNLRRNDGIKLFEQTAGKMRSRLN